MPGYEIPDDIFEPMPPETYCKCGTIWVGLPKTSPGVSATLRIKCQACGFWTGPVPTSGE